MSNRSAQEIMRENGWTVGTRLEGTEHYPKTSIYDGGWSTEVIEITYLCRNKRDILARTISRTSSSGRYDQIHESEEERGWVLDNREWKALDQPQFVKRTETGSSLVCTTCGRHGYQGGKWQDDCLAGHPFPCPDCERKFSSKMALSTHTRSHKKQEVS